MRRPPPAAADTAAPLTPSEFAALLEALGPFEPAPRLAVAVSGGPDSMALAILTAQWARARGGEAIGLVVDHGLRPESGAEAAQAAAWLQELCVVARILTWDGVKPATGIQAAARAARMALLLDACRADAILHLLLAHQREDQAETVVLRRAAGSGAAGLAGMAAVREVPGLRLLRPLLATRKARLISTLAAMGQPWLVDPANLSPCFARGRLRSDPTFAPDEPWEESVEHAKARRAEDGGVAAWLARIARPHRLGFVRLDAALWSGLEPSLRAALLKRLLATVGGRDYPVADNRLSRICGAALAAPATIGGCIIVRRGGDLLLCREPGRIRHQMSLLPGSAGRWDGRFAVRYERGPIPVEVRPLAIQGARLLGATVRRVLRREGVPAIALHGLPAVWAGSAMAACPTLSSYGVNEQAGLSITADLRPTLPLTTAPFIGVNVVSNPLQPIYRPVSARVPVREPASAVSPSEPPGPTLRRTL